MHPANYVDDDDVNVAISTLASKFARLKGELQKATDAEAQTRGRLIVREKELQIKSEEIDNYEKKIKDMQQELVTQHEICAKTTAERTDYQQKMQDAQAECADLGNKLKEIEQELEKVRHAQASCEDFESKSKKAVESELEKRKAVESELKKTKKELKRMQDSQAKRAASENELQNKLNDSETKISQFQRRLRWSNQRWEHLQKERLIPCWLAPPQEGLRVKLFAGEFEKLTPQDVLTITSVNSDMSIISLRNSLDGTKTKLYEDVLLQKFGYKDAEVQLNGVQRSEDGHVKLGNMRYNRNDVIGRGSNGTVVYAGDASICGTDLFVEAAIKVASLSSDQEESEKQRMRQLRSVEMAWQCRGAQVVAPLGTFEYESKFYTAWERCSTTLEHEFQTQDDGPFDNFDSRRDACKQILSALQTLRDRHNVLHLDFHPRNILKAKDARGKVVWKVHDFERAIRGKEGSSTNVSVGVEEGELELLQNLGISESDLNLLCTPPEFPHFSDKADIWYAGVSIYFCLSGKHAFDCKSQRTRPAWSARANYLKDALKNAIPSAHRAVEAYDLLCRMMDPNPSKRPTRNAVDAHPFFLDHAVTAKRIERLHEYFDKLEKEDSPTFLLKSCDYGWKDKIVQSDFLSQALKDSERYNKRPYFPHLPGLMRFCRNALQHPIDYPDFTVGRLLETFPELSMDIHKDLPEGIRQTVVQGSNLAGCSHGGASQARSNGMSRISWERLASDADNSLSDGDSAVSSSDSSTYWSRPRRKRRRRRDYTHS